MKVNDPCASVVGIFEYEAVKHAVGNLHMDPSRCQETAIEVSSDLDHIEHAVTIMVYRVRRITSPVGRCTVARRSPFFRSEPWAPFVFGCDGHIFTSMPENPSNDVVTYQEDWMRDLPGDVKDTCIGFIGHRGQLATLLGKAILIFDYQPHNIDIVRAHATEQAPMDGFLVPRTFQHPMANDTQQWPLLLAEFTSAQSDARF